MHWQKETFHIDTDRNNLDIAYIHAFLSQSYWAENIPLETVQRSIKGSLCFGVFDLEKQIGFARVITDGATFAYLADVFIDSAYRGQGLSKWLMECILSYPSLQGLRRFILATKDAHTLYAKYGFTPLTFVDKWMHRHQPGIYKNGAKKEENLS